MSNLVEELAHQHLEEHGGRYKPCPFCGTDVHGDENRGVVRTYDTDDGLGGWVCTEPNCPAHDPRDALALLSGIRNGEPPPPRGDDSWQTTKWKKVSREYRQLTGAGSGVRHIKRGATNRRSNGHQMKKSNPTRTASIKGTTAKAVDDVHQLGLDRTHWPSPRKPDEGEPHYSSWNEVTSILASPRTMPPGGKRHLPVWNFSKFESDYRKGDHHKLASALVIDYDSDDEFDENDPRRGNLYLGSAELERCWGTLAACAHTTPSHRPGMSRWRLIIPLSRPVDLKTYKDVADWAIEHGNRNGAQGLDADTSWRSAVQAFYMPGNIKGYETWFSSSTRLLDVEQALEQLDEWRRQDAELARRVKNYMPGCPVPDELGVPHGYLVDATGIVKLNDNPEGEDYRFTPRPVLIRQIETNIESGEQVVVLTWPGSGSAGWQEARVTRDVIAQARTIPQLAKFGMPVTSANARFLVPYLAEFEDANGDTIPRIITTPKLGWFPPGTSNPRGFVLGQRWLGEPPSAIPAHETGLAQLAGALEAAGDAKMEQHHLSKACEHPGVLLVTLTSLCTPLLTILDAPGFSFSIAGTSSQGKTSALRVAMSPWGRASEHDARSVVRSWDLTPVFAERTHTSLVGIPMALDDTALARYPDVVARLLYGVPGGTSRGRATKNADVRATDAGRTILISTGETPVLSASTSGGTRARVLELWHPLWGAPDQKTGEMIREVVAGLHDHHGHTGCAWVQHILDNRDNWPAWRSRYRQIESDIAGELLKRHGHGGNAGILVRFAGHLAAIILTGELAVPEVLPASQTTLTNAMELLLEVPVKEAAQRDVLLEAREYVFSVAGARRADLAEGASPSNSQRVPPQGWLGRWDTGSNLAYFIVSQLREILQKSRYDYQATVRGWGERGWLAKTGPDRLDTTVRIDGETVRAVALTVPDDLVNTTGATTPASAAPAQRRARARWKTKT